MRQLGLVLTFRFVLCRVVAALVIADILFVVLIADASEHATAGEYKSITDGSVPLGTKRLSVAPQPIHRRSVALEFILGRFVVGAAKLLPTIR